MGMDDWTHSSKRSGTSSSRDSSSVSAMFNSVFSSKTTIIGSSKVPVALVMVAGEMTGVCDEGMEWERSRMRRKRGEKSPCFYISDPLFTPNGGQRVLSATTARDVARVIPLKSAGKPTLTCFSIQNRDSGSHGSLSCRHLGWLQAASSRIRRCPQWLVWFLDVFSFAGSRKSQHLHLDSIHRRAILIGEGCSLPPPSRETVAPDVSHEAALIASDWSLQSICIGYNANSQRS
ncbi:hypothetical protein FRC19_010989 [Serendipita sp. 401]|nr:hypothetical protein FRC19_010989 [Serendipita sp. 401]